MCTLFAFLTTKIALSRFIMRSLFPSLFIACILTNIARATPTFGTKLIWQMLMMLIIIIIRRCHFKSQNESTHNKPGSRWRSSRAAVGAVKGAGQHLLVVCWGCHRFGVSGRTLWPMSWLTTTAVTTHTHAHVAAGVKCWRNQMQWQLQLQSQMQSAAAPASAPAPAAASFAVAVAL